MHVSHLSDFFRKESSRKCKGICKIMLKMVMKWIKRVEDEKGEKNIFNDFFMLKMKEKFVFFCLSLGEKEKRCYTLTCAVGDGRGRRKILNFYTSMTLHTHIYEYLTFLVPPPSMTQWIYPFEKVPTQKSLLLSALRQALNVNSFSHHETHTHTHSRSPCET